MKGVSIFAVSRILRNERKGSQGAAAAVLRSAAVNERVESRSS